MDCLLLRHGIAVDPEDWTGQDETRPLTAKGKKRVRQAADGLVSLEFEPTHLLSSPFLRAVETAELIRSALCPKLAVELREELAVGSSPELVVSLLRTLPRDSAVVCVGHEPLLGEVAGLLLCGKQASGFSLKKSGAALIRLSGPAKPGQGELRWWLQPAHLRALGKRVHNERTGEG
jgi:phosphohistidine phosphatase